jgi:hypothetical protein
MKLKFDINKKQITVYNQHGCKSVYGRYTVLSRPQYKEYGTGTGKQKSVRGYLRRDRQCFRSRIPPPVLFLTDQVGM